MVYGGCSGSKYNRRVDLVSGLLEPPMAHRDAEDDHLWGERLTEKSDTVLLWCTPKGSVGGFGLNTEHVPDIGERDRAWHLPG